ncbi:hypothetical protein CsSME_00050826 [Camellia sinensis var. sinensis]
MPRIRIWDKQEVVIEKVVRNRRKCITTVKGVDFLVIRLFFFPVVSSVKLSEASKKLGKKC